MLKCERRTSLHAVQYKWQPASVLMFCPSYLEMASLDTLCVNRHFGINMASKNQFLCPE